MNNAHNIKIEVEIITKKFSCSLCTYTTSNMNEFKMHQITMHKKDPHNWMVDEIREIYSCEECSLQFPEKVGLDIHMDKSHSGDKVPIVLSATRFLAGGKEEEFVSSGLKIIPDQEFLTQNTADLKARLEAIPKDTLIYQEDIFEKDFKEVLNSVDIDNKMEDYKDIHSYNCDDCKFRSSSPRCLKAHIKFVHDPNFYKCDFCPVKTKTELAMHYHIDMKHNTYWEVEAEAREIPFEQIKIKTESNTIEGPGTFGCEFCERYFITGHGRRIHTSKMHKENLRNKELIKSSHNEDFNLERKHSVTKSPPAKKTKESPGQSEKVKHIEKEIYQKENDPKDDEILRLKGIITQLQYGLLRKEAKPVRHPQVLDPVINVITVLEEKEIQSNQRPQNKPPHKIGKNRQNPQAPSKQTVSICSHRQEITIEDIPEFEYLCDKCGKGFREKANLVEHMTCHTWRFCECTYPCIPIKAPIGTGPETSEVTPEIKNSDPIHSQDDQDCQKCDDSEKQSTVRANLNNHIKNDPFVFAYCTECEIGFSHKSNLSSHKRSHIQQ